MTIKRAIAALERASEQCIIGPVAEAVDEALTALRSLPRSDIDAGIVLAIVDRERKMREKLADIRSCFLGIDKQAERLLGPPSIDWHDEEIIVGYKLNTGLWHRLHGLLADVDDALK